MYTETFELTAYVADVGEIEVYPRKGKRNLFKQRLDLEIKDGQVLYAEVRKKLFPIMKELRVGMPVKVRYNFIGVEKEGKKYNNIVVYEINKI